MPSDLTGAEIEMLRSLPQRLGVQSRASAGKREQAALRRREQLQRAGLLRIEQIAGASIFVVTIMPSGVAALQAATGGRR